MLERPLGTVERFSDRFRSAGQYTAVFVARTVRGESYLTKAYAAAELACRTAHMQLATAGSWKLKGGLHWMQEACTQAERMECIRFVAAMFGQQVGE